MRKRIVFIILILVASNLFSQELVFNSLDELMEFYINRGYTLSDPNVNSPITVAVLYFMEKNPNIEIKSLTPIFADYLFIYINYSLGDNIPNIATGAIRTFNGVEYQFYKINYNTEITEERIYLINGQNVRFNVFY